MENESTEKKREFSGYDSNFSFASEGSVIVMQESEIIEILTDNSDIFETSTIAGKYVFRPIIWAVVKFMCWLSNLCQNLYISCFKFIDFTTYGPVKSFLDEFDGAVVVTLAASLLIIAITHIINPEKKKTPILNNFLIGMLVMCTSASLLSSFNNLLLQGTNYITGTYGDTGLAAEQIVSDNLTDLLYVDKKIGLNNVSENNIPHANLSNEAIKNINYADVIDTDSNNISTSEGKDILKKKAVYMEGISDTNYALVEINDGNFVTNIFAEFYFRYQINFFTVFLSILALCIVFLVMGYKVIRLIWELLTSMFLTVILSGEIVSGQGMKKLLGYIRDIYIVLLYTTVAIKFFILAVGFVGNNFPKEVRGFILIFIAFAVADGPAVVEKILGIDAGLQSGMGKAMAAMHMASGFLRGTTGMLMQMRTNQRMDNIADAITNLNREDISNSSSSPDIENQNNQMNMNQSNETRNVHSNQEVNAADQDTSYDAEGDMKNQDTEHINGENELNSEFSGNKDTLNNEFAKDLNASDWNDLASNGIDDLEKYKNSKANGGNGMEEYSPKKTQMPDFDNGRYQTDSVENNNLNLAAHTQYFESERMKPSLPENKAQESWRIYSNWKNEQKKNE